MSVIDRIDKFMVTEAKLRGFKDKKALAAEIEDMDNKVETKHMLKFEKVLNKYLDKIDPKSKFDIAHAITLLKDRDAIALYDELLQFSYED